MDAADRSLAEAIRAELGRIADPSQAPQMQAYMKSAMPYLGVRVPQVRAAVRALAKNSPPRSGATLRDTTLLLWRDARFREERYAATALTDVPGARALRSPEQLTLYRELIVTGAWWDHVDEVSHRVGDLLCLFRAEVAPVIRTWLATDDHWLRRSAIICQVGHRDDTDAALLSDAIEANAAESDFFLRKAIGWALRDYARTDPGWVRAFVAAHELSPLSRREALKHLG